MFISAERPLIADGVLRDGVAVRLWSLPYDDPVAQDLVEQVQQEYVARYGGRDEAVVDPAELRWFGGPLIGWPPLTVYSVTFLIFWGAIATAGALTALLSIPENEVDALGLGRRFP